MYITASLAILLFACMGGGGGGRHCNGLLRFYYVIVYKIRVGCLSNRHAGIGTTGFIACQCNMLAETSLFCILKWQNYWQLGIFEKSAGS